MWELGEHFRNYADEYRDAVHEHFFNAVPESRQIFALSMRDTHTSMVPALAWVIEHTEPGSPCLPTSPQSSPSSPAITAGMGFRPKSMPASTMPSWRDCGFWR